MRAFNTIRFPLLALGLAFTLGCSADSPSSPTAPPSNPIPPAVGINVSVTSSTASLEAGSTGFATLVIRATRADNGQAVPNLTPGTITTTLGSLGSNGGPQTQNVEMVNGQATVVFFPGATVGTASIRAAVSTGVGFTAVTVREPGTPDTFFLSSVSPSTGSPQGGDTVTINGGGIASPIRVTFDGIPAVVQSASATQIRVITPRCGDPVTSPATGCWAAGATKSVDVAVTIHLNEEGQASDTLSSGFTYVNGGGGGGGVLTPTIFSVTPSSGPNEGGTQVTINGDGFEAPVGVTFGGINAQVVSVTRTRVVATSPPATGIGSGNLNQLVTIEVLNQGSGRRASAANAFRYGGSVTITSIAPGQGTIYGGTLVTLFGHGFDAPVAVDFGGIAQQPVSVSGTEVVVRTTHPTSCPSGSLTSNLVNIESGDGDSGPPFLYLKPNAVSLSPASGSQAGGTNLTIGGANFGLPIAVDFVIGGSTYGGNVTNATATSITVVTPSIPDSAFGTVACDDNGDTQPGQRYIPTSATVRVTDPISGCTDETPLEGQFTFNPTDTSCRNDSGSPNMFISAITPTQGSIYGGTLVTLSGQGFSAPVAVDFGGVAQDVVSVSGNTGAVVRTTHPAFCPSGGLASHLVNINSGNGASGPPFLYLKPNAVSLSSASGSQSGGTNLTIGGANFGLPITVDFNIGGSTHSGNVTNATATSINVTTPSIPDSALASAACNDDGDTHPGQRYIPTEATVRITDPLSGCTDTLEQQFTFNPTNTTCRDDAGPPTMFISSISPTQGSVYATTLLTITGQGFAAPVSVIFAGTSTSLQVVSVSSTTITATVPRATSCETTGQRVTVTNTSTNLSATSSVGFQYLAPAIFSFSPASGSQSGGTAVTFNGSNLGTPIAVDFSIGGTTRAANVTSATATTVHATTPSFPDSAMAEVDCNDNAIDPIGKRYVGTAASITVQDPISGCEANVGGSFVFNPTNTTCRGD